MKYDLENHGKRGDPALDLDISKIITNMPTCQFSTLIICCLWHQSPFE